MLSHYMQSSSSRKLLHNCRACNYNFGVPSFSDFHTRAENIYIPDFGEWRKLHAAWHRTDKDVDSKQLSKLLTRYLMDHSHRRDKCAKSPENCEWCLTGVAADDYLNRLLCDVEETCSLFAAEQIIHYGSSAEKTNILGPIDFDYGIILANFSQSLRDPNQIVYTGDDPTYMLLNDDDHPINSSSLLFRFMNIIADSLQHVYSDHVSCPTVSLRETCVTIHFLYHGPHFEPILRVNMDVTIAVKASQQPTMISLGWFVSDVEESIVLLVPSRTGIGSQWRLSYPTLERDMLLNSGDVVARVYQLLKLMVALNHAKGNLSCEIPRKCSLSSYALKTCLFSYMRYRYKPPPWQPEDTFRHAMGILRQFPVNSKEMRSFFNKEIVVFNVTMESKRAVKEIISILNKMV